MEEPNLLENGKSPQKRKPTFIQVTFYTIIFVLIIISALLSMVFCLLHHNQAPGLCWAHGLLNASLTLNSSDVINWEWDLENCRGLVKDDGQYLRIEQSGRYFIYAQVNRCEKLEESFTLMLIKHPNILLNKAVGPKEGDEKGTVNFARPFSLKKGDKLFCRGNFRLDKIVSGNQSYWGLFKM